MVDTLTVLIFSFVMVSLVLAAGLIALNINARELREVRADCAKIEKQIIANANRNDPLVRVLLGELK